LVPLDTLAGDRYTYHENVRKIIGERSRRQYSIGDHVRVRLDRVDGVEKKLQFSVVGSQTLPQNRERQRVAGKRVTRNSATRKPKRRR
ncbi:MAG: ribonuclease R, partial [Candidatus Sulfotelmatobacter sp.]